MRSKTYMSKINLQSGILTVENRRSREKKRICSEVSVNSPGYPWRQRSQETDDVDVEKRGVDSGRDKMSHIERNDHM